jgi:transketolase N-terminal domain/subunit
MEKQQLLELKKTAVRIRRHIIDAVYHAGSGHPGGSLSCTDILTVLYFKHMNVNINDPNDLDRDRFVMSKGHCAPALYATLAEKGFFSTEELKNLRKIDRDIFSDVKIKLQRSYGFYCYGIRKIDRKCNFPSSCRLFKAPLHF